jgi:hypothetical protein
MRHSYDLPQDDGSHWILQCPPSHHKMVLTPNHEQASTRAPQPSQPSTGSPMLSAPVSPYHQQGSTKPSAAPVAHSSCHFVPFVSMGGGKPTSEAARLLARVDGTLTHVLWGINAITFPLPLCALCEHGGGMHSVGWLFTAANRGSSTQLPRVDGALACYFRGGKAITMLGPSFLAKSVFSHPHSINDGGERRLDSMPCSGLGSLSILRTPSPFADKLTLLLVRLAYPIHQSPRLGCKELTAIKKAAMNAVMSALQHWYC